jgi:excinuclease ABC subunit C
MIDGGKGQLSAVMEALREMRLDDELLVCSLAKQREEVFLPGAKQPLVSEAEQLGVQVLRRLRDEAHRFAVSFHRQQRGERMKRSRLSDIPGLGPKRVKELLAHFRSIDAIQLASQASLAAAPGVGPMLAAQIWEYFHPQEAQQPGDDDQFPADQIPDDQIFEDQIPEQRIPAAQGLIEIEAPAAQQTNSNPEHWLELAC